MSFFGIGLHVLIAIFFAVHAIRNDRGLYWLIILFSFPLLGSLVYFFAVYLPHSRLHSGLRQVSRVAVQSLDPGRELREARNAFELTPTAQNQMRLAQALMEAGDIAQAVRQFDQCLQGPFSKDAEIRQGAARAKLLNNQADAAEILLKQIRHDTPSHRPEQVSLLLAQALALQSKTEEARREYQSAVAKFGSVEARAEYAIWSAATGDIQVAQSLQRDLEQAQKHMTQHSRNLHRDLFRRLEAALSAKGGSISSS